ncbi:MAG: DUF11 domain-containing protein [Clostridiales bacterium]|jgi:uncharacterized repeat protein (TIGR01451 family)|nr:DUF11 domain-containing protein [Clostridiales bacterium]
MAEQSANLDPTKIANVTSIAPGGTFHYTITLENVGNGPTANPYLIRDTFPPNISYAGGAYSSSGAAVTYTTSGNTVSFYIHEALMPDQSRTFIIPVKVSATAPAGVLTANSAFLDPGDGGGTGVAAETNPPVVTGKPSLTISKVSDKRTAYPGSTFNYVITVANQGTAPTTNPLTITDPLPQHLALNGTPASGLGVVTNSGTNTNLHLTIPATLAPGQTATITIPVIVSG